MDRAYVRFTISVLVLLRYPGNRKFAILGCETRSILADHSPVSDIDPESKLRVVSSQRGGGRKRRLFRCLKKIGKNEIARWISEMDTERFTVPAIRVIWFEFSEID
jgi:hypothetical protein